MVTSLSGKSRGGSEVDFPPVSQLNKPPDDDWVATEVELANLFNAPLLVRPYHIVQQPTTTHFQTIRI